MNTKTLSSRAMSVIGQYIHFKVGSAVTSVPYFNNKTVGTRAALRVNIGKGSPKEIFDEVNTLITKNRLPIESLADESLKRMLCDSNLGIDCSGFAYYVLNAESEERGFGKLDKKLSFVNATGLLGKIRSSFRPIENADVSTFASNENSSAIAAGNAQPGDFISMTGSPEGAVRDHVLIVHQVEYQNFIATKIHYSHAVAYPEDGLYGSGLRQGIIEITDPSKSVTEQRWIENEKEGSDNLLFMRARRSKTELRRLHWFS